MANTSQAAVCENSSDDIAPKSMGVSHQVVPRSILIPFILLTSCFALWGLANNMTDVLIAQFKKVFTLLEVVRYFAAWISDYQKKLIFHST